MSGGLRLGLFIASFCVFVIIIVAVVNRKLNIKYSIVWLLWSLLTIFLAALPEIFYEISDLLGVQTPANTVFLIMTSLLYILTFYVYLMISKHNEEIIKLTYSSGSAGKNNKDLEAEITILRKEIEELKNNER